MTNPLELFKKWLSEQPDEVQAEHAADVAALEARAAAIADAEASAKAVKPVRVIPAHIVGSLGLTNGMSLDAVEAKIEAWFIANGECD
jgi:hypothetical protein